ncbi:MAG: HNH endonuclease [Dehalococcoidia bacterium]|nr:HNH endonuclease [Dehalococcoidia bacterium]MCB9485234.1 HNH endonuclease [Thermoflexaceae bacterium]
MAGVRLEVDHVVPLANAGSNEARNLRTLCAPCHHQRSRGLKTGRIRAQASPVQELDRPHGATAEARWE